MRAVYVLGKLPDISGPGLEEARRYIEGVACVTIAAETLTHQDHGVLPTSLWFLVDRHVPEVMLQGRVLASIELMSLRQRAFDLLHHRMLEQCANLVVGPTILERRGF